MKLKNKIFNTYNSKTTILIRLTGGAIFFSKGIQKYLFLQHKKLFCRFVRARVGSYSVKSS